MKEMEASIRSDMTDMNHSLSSDIKDLRRDVQGEFHKMTIKLGSLMAIGIGLISVLNKV